MDFKNLRKELMIVVNTMNKLEGSREISLAKTKAQEAMMWCGNYLKYSGEGQNPYAENDGKRKTVKDIKPMFDATESTLHENILSEGQIFVVDQLRQILDKKINDVGNYLTDLKKLDEINDFQEIMVGLCFANLPTKLSETRMWLGMELGRLRDLSDLGN
jgi:hypothetical protein